MIELCDYAGCVNKATERIKTFLLDKKKTIAVTLKVCSECYKEYLKASEDNIGNDQGADPSGIGDLFKEAEQE